MKNTTGEHWDSLVPSREDIAKSRRVPDTPQTKAVHQLIESNWDSLLI